MNSASPEPTEAEAAQEEAHGRLVSGVVLPEDPSVEELARNWTLSEADISEVLLCRGTDNCLRFALQLCVLRRYGRFLEEYDSPPVRIVNHFAMQLHLPPVLLLAPPRSATESEYRDRLRQYLLLRDLDQKGRDLLAAWVSERMADGEAPDPIAGQAEQVVRSWRYVLPRATVFTRMIYSFCARAESDVFERIAAQVPAEGRRAGRRCTAAGERQRHRPTGQGADRHRESGQKPSFSCDGSTTRSYAAILGCN
jgi:hypothetical protein